MKQYVEWTLELIGLGGLITLLVFVKWTNVILGSVLSLIGAFFPQLRSNRAGAGEAKTTFGKISVAFQGSLRYGVVIAGIILIIGGIVSGFQDWQRELQIKQRELQVQQLEIDSIRLALKNSADDRFLTPSDLPKMSPESAKALRKTIDDFMAAGSPSPSAAPN
jgi:hypothetical protein